VTIDAAGYRRIIGRFATGVTVVTTANEGRLHGITANAVCSVSLDPLLLLVCVDKEAHAHDELIAAGRFGVNILAEGQEELSNLFATKAEPEQGSLRGVSYRLGPEGTPVLEGALAYLECTVEDRCPGGDHTIFIGQVLGGEMLREAPPLLFYQGAYRRLQA
jgi:flavin reductase (DIM6/NTAB) family NADH-FMN oxidoreductase RutF